MIWLRSWLSGALLGLVVVLILVAGTVGASPTGISTTQSDNETQFIVTQGDECYQVSAIGGAWENVSAFYGYRDNSSRRTADYQDNNVSNLLLFHGTEGYSLVFIHNRDSGPSDQSWGGTATMEITGLPPAGEWVIMDDDYTGSDDQFTERGTRAKISWKWVEGRTDGGVYRGLNTTNDLDIVVTPRFNEDAEAWGEWPWSGDEANRTDSWRLYTDRETTVQLDMDEQVRIMTGTCAGTEPEGALTVTPDNVSVDEPVTLDARGLTDETGVFEYRWDFDGDGRTDRMSNSSSVTHTYETVGQYEASVEARDGDPGIERANIDITVSENRDDTATESGEREDGGNGGAGGSNAGGTSSSDGPGFGFLTGFIALLVVLLLGRR